MCICTCVYAINCFDVIPVLRAYIYTCMYIESESSSHIMRARVGLPYHLGSCSCFEF